jgi:hypothetical protein
LFSVLVILDRGEKGAISSKRKEFAKMKELLQSVTEEDY